jgi:hypothetical protein
MLKVNALLVTLLAFHAKLAVLPNAESVLTETPQLTVFALALLPPQF